MAFTIYNSIYNETCSPLPLPCNFIGPILMLNPCECSSFIQCLIPNRISYQNCAEGTLFDPVSRRCQDEAKVTCDEEKPWLRCDQVDDNYSEDYLSGLCSDHVQSSSTTTSVYRETTTGDIHDGGGGNSTIIGSNSSEDNSSNSAGAIVGGVVGGVVVIVIMLVILIFFNKRRKEMSQSLHTHERQVSHTHSKQEHMDEEDIYYEINDSMVSVVATSYSQQRYVNIKELQSHTNKGFDPGPTEKRVRNIDGGSSTPTSKSSDILKNKEKKDNSSSHLVDTNMIQDQDGYLMPVITSSPGDTQTSSLHGEPGHEYEEFEFGPIKKKNNSKDNICYGLPDKLPSER